MQTLDLNLLRLFDVMLEEGSATRAGARLGLSQSAVSHALNRLRHALGDELFVRSPQGMAPTARARELGPRVHAALRQLQSALAPSEFEPLTTERRFVLVAGGYACAVLVPALVARMAEVAPRASLAVTDAAPDLLEQLDSGRADFLIGGATAAPERLAQKILLRESLAWVVRPDSPLGRLNQVTFEDLVSVQHVVIARDGSSHWRSDGGLVMRASWEDFGALETMLRARGLQRRIGVSVPDTYSAMAVVARSDMAAVIPRRMAAMASQKGSLKVIEPPYDASAVDLSLLFLRERAADPAIAWMARLLREVATQL